MATKKFKFRLEPLAKIKKHREKERQKEHAAALKKVHDQIDALTGIGGQRLETLKTQRRKSVGKIVVAEALVCSRYLQRLKRERIAGEELLHGLENKAEERRLTLVDAAKERKIFELLEEKQRIRHYKNLDKLEQKEIDEIALQKFQRQADPA